MSYRNDYTACLGELVPVYWQELVPNSSWHCRVHGLIRLQPLIAPIMDNLDYYLHFWEAPHRVLYGEQFTDLVTGEIAEEESSLPYFTPYNVYNNILDAADDADITKYLVGNGSLFDLLGYDIGLFVNGVKASEGKINARKIIMYARLLVHWYINENVEPWDGFVDELTSWCDPKLNIQGDLSADIADFVYKIYDTFGSRFFCHAWAADYFTKALPSLQYGTATYLPLGDSAPVTFAEGTTTLGQPVLGFGEEVATDDLFNGVSSNKTAVIGSKNNGDPTPVLSIQGNLATPDLTADLSEATAISINELRLTNAIQVFKEREMRFGRRAPEYYKGFFNVTPEDMRLQLPKFLGGGRMPINISDIEQTSQTSESSPQGNLAGKGTGLAGGFAKASCFAPEETLVLGLAWAMPKITYAQLLSRHDTKLNDRFLYFNPSFTHIGEQEVFNYEIYAPSYGTDLGSTEFGYQPRYTEYRFHANELHGDFKDSLSFWTLGRIFNSQPALNAAFIYMQPKALNRIFAVQNDTLGNPVANMLVSLKFSCSVIQPIARYGTPSLIV